MMEKQKQNVAINKSWQRLGFLLALGSLWMMLTAIELSDLATNGSSHLSSNSTLKALTSTQVASQAVKFYDLQLKLKSDQRIQLDNGNTALLRKGSTISVSVTDKILGNETDPSKVNLSRILDTIRNSTNNNGINEFSIIESSNRELIGESSKINLSNLVQRRAIDVHNIEEEVLETGLNENEGSVCVDCKSGESNNRNAPNFVEIFKRIMDPKYAEANPVSGYSAPALTSIDALVKAYESSSEVQNLMGSVKKGYKVRQRRRSFTVRDGVRSRSYGACYAGVKTALQRAGMVDRYLPGGSAKDAGPHLKRDGFINLLDTDYKEKITSPFTAPVGAVLVYEGHAGTRVRGDKNYRHGHIEIRTNEGFISDYFSQTPRTGNAMAARGRKLVGVYIKSTSNVGQLALNDSSSGDK